VPSKARIIRKQADGSYVELPLPLADMQKGKQPDMPLEANDVIYVPFSYVRNIAVNLGGLIASTSSAAIYVAK
jgi:polysaccharide export outer membrane protein